MIATGLLWGLLQFLAVCARRSWSLDRRLLWIGRFARDECERRGRERRGGTMGRRVEVADGDGVGLCSILESDIGIWRVILALSMYFGCASSSVGCN